MSGPFKAADMTPTSLQKASFGVEILDRAYRWPWPTNLLSADLWVPTG